MAWVKKEAGIKDAELKAIAELAKDMLGVLYHVQPVLGDLVRDGYDYDDLNESYAMVKGVINRAEELLK